MSDPDRGESLFTSETGIAGTYGSYSIVTDGQWNYRATNTQSAIQALAYDQALTDSVTVFSVDGSASQVLTVDILTSLPALIGGNRTGSLTRNNDVDAADI